MGDNEAMGSGFISLFFFPSDCLFLLFDQQSVEGSSSNQRIQSSSVHDYIGTSKLSIGMPAYRFDHHADINTDADDDDTVFAEDTDSETETLGMRHSDLRKPTSLKFGLKGGGALILDNEETRTPPFSILLHHSQTLMIKDMAFRLR